MGTLYNPDYVIAVKCLQNYRIRAGLTQVELASKLGVSQTYISNYEQAQKRLDIIEIRNICLCLGVTLAQFVENFEEHLKAKTSD